MAIIYAVFGVLWFTASDLVVERLPNHLLYQTATGWVFVFVSAGLVYTLVEQSHVELTRASSRLESTNAHASVLHRILRHDIRNACTAILGYAELVEPRSGTHCGTDPVVAIRKRANRLVEVSEEVSLLRSVEQAEGSTVEVNLSCAVSDAVDDIRLEYPSVSISVSAPPELSVTVHPALPRSITELLDNAVVHADCESPTVGVTVRQVGDVASVAVTDDGPGIPEIDRKALVSGAETPLRHTTGVGLWLVRSIVEASGGSVDIQRLSSKGTSVVLYVPVTGT
ncbi:MULTISPECIES: sensor histidine kinase KdpD [Haloferax]|uniref:histidine kinase n=2 Tax=Haloferax TaxID=2251 RepID=A0A6G1Z0L5_9EURY|nr:MULTISPECIES: HAMP domain-containing sensor histidine kinase [Haloferax]KAB1189217.1 HAMP domain-containing histidine kinase [Haloferax sp. CBA1149]MRW80062.1 sensor histidine kinase [Haloferax marinisediminis]